MDIKLEETNRDPRLGNILKKYATMIADAEQFWDYTKSGLHVDESFDEYKKRVHQAEDFMDSEKMKIFSEYSLTNDKYYENVPNSTVTHRILKVINDSGTDGIPMAEANILVKPNTIAKQKGHMFGDYWNMLLYKFNWIKTKRVEVSPNTPYREIRYVLTDEGKKALDAFERYGHVPDVDYDKFIKTPKSDLSDSDFEYIYNSAN